MLKLKIHYEAHGPILDGSANRLLDNAMPMMERRIAQEGLRMIHQRLGHVLKHPTGYYESRVMIDNSSASPMVTDSGVIYGPWLEGVSRRNTTTRFKGYHTFRMVAQELDSKKLIFAEMVLDPVFAQIGAR